MTEPVQREQSLCTGFILLWDIPCPMGKAFRGDAPALLGQALRTCKEGKLPLMRPCPAREACNPHGLRGRANAALPALGPGKRVYVREITA